MKKTSLIVSLFVVGLVVLALGNVMKPLHAASQVEKKTLVEEIRSYAKEVQAKPIDAKIDRVWKAIPGYNGLSVDIDASVQKMWPGQTFDKDKIVLKEVPPQVHLSDLPPSPIYRGNPEKPMVALFINVAWGNEFIPTILETLKKHDVKATFFFDGSWVKKNPDLAKSIYQEKHEIGNHAYSHPDLQHLSQQATIEELNKTSDVIEQTLGIRPEWFAPPSGSFNQQTIEIARKLDMYTVLWTVDTVDWRKPATADMVRKVLSEISSGSMILMHPTKPVAEGLGEMIEGIEKQGYVLGTVSQIMSEKRIEGKEGTGKH